ncbi:polar residue-rich protein 7 [Diadegma semiclausum ichnovirus]|nr:polar residue-rich protein 7 [Diadegma semiclausum ichnovirus]
MWGNKNNGNSGEAARRAAKERWEDQKAVWERQEKEYEERKRNREEQRKLEENLLRACQLSNECQACVYLLINVKTSHYTL